ncbi:MAG: TrmH family RNA methyltransferase [Pseudomonadota bacterium]
MRYELALYQPEIAENLGACIRIAACFGARLHVVEPCGFPWKSRDISRVAMDYGQHALPHRHSSWDTFQQNLTQRIILLTTAAEHFHDEVSYQDGDVFLIGQESAGVPKHVHDRADVRVRIPLHPSARSLNMAVSGSIALAEAQRQMRQK